MSQLQRTLQVSLFDKDGVRQGWISDPIAVSVSERFLAQSTGEITVRATEPKLSKMLSDGARVAVHFLQDDAAASTLFVPDQGYQLISGPLRNPRGKFTAGGLVTFQIEGDWRVLRNTRSRVVPANPLMPSTLADPAQSYDLGAPPPVGEDTGRGAYYKWPAGPQSASLAVTTFINDQVNNLYLSQLGISNFVQSSPIAGPDVTDSLPQVRFGNVEDVVVPILRSAGIGYRIFYGEQLPDIWRLFGAFWEPKIWPTVYTPESGVVQDGDWSLGSHNATHVDVGGPGELSSRAFYPVNDGTGLAVAHRDIIEVFREATGAPVEWPSSLAETLRIAKYYLLRPEITTDQKAAFEKFLQAAGADALLDGAPTAGVSLQLAESEGFRFTGYNMNPRGFAVGDIVTCAPSAETALTGLQFTDRITECTISMSTDKGLTVAPQLGQKTDDPDVELTLAVRALANAQARKNTAQ